MRGLIIDDNPLHAELAARRLQEENWKMDITDTVEPKEEYRDYDFILLDYSMPQRSGLEVLRKIKEMGLTLPVILLTGHGNETIASEAIKLGAYDYVVKDTKLVYLDRLSQVIKDAKSKHELIETNKFLIQELRRANEKLQKLSLTDELTGIFNYRFIQKQLQIEIERALRYGKNFSVCMIDVDHFKKINDEYGHPAGDQVIKEISQILQRSTRSVDYVGRHGGDEFIIIFPDTELSSAVKLCERIRKSVSEYNFKLKGKTMGASLSMGVTDFHPKTRKNLDQIISAADKCLYQAKRSGRNCVFSTMRLLKSAQKTSDASAQV